jgi:hypothetical protein
MQRFNQRLLLIGLVLFTVSNGFAQLVQVHMGATTAVNATFVLDKGLSEDPRYNSTYTYKFAPVGFNFGVNFGRKFGLSLESILSHQGDVYQIIDAAEQVKGKRTIDMTYLQLPLLMNFLGGGNGGARANFNIGPQLSLLQKAKETVQADAGTYTIPDQMSFQDIKEQFPDATDNGDGTYNMGAIPSTDVLTKEANDFKNQEFAIAGAFGLDIDLSKHMYLTTQVRATYSLTDMRNEDVIQQIKDGGNIFANRANLLVGVQLGLHYMIGGKTRSFKFKDDSK